ncbi:hypothetical protein U0070_000914 [Myodes glareolus]|uniref:Uncharacterized protein n=1 Tax=Myodes glareolus TaxID=447135 RepID=A0AAW0I0L8_MYOGA
MYDKFASGRFLAFVIAQRCPDVPIGNRNDRNSILREGVQRKPLGHPGWDIDGCMICLDKYKGFVCIVTNVASQ